MREKSKQYVHPSYDPTTPLVPHGLAVSLTAPAVFNFTAPSSPDRHREAAALFLGKDRVHELDSVSDADIGPKLREEIWRFLESVEVPRGLKAIGYGSEDIENVSAKSEESGYTLMVACSRSTAAATGFEPRARAGEG
jgi:hydroxyacid-oxoacid transhydrogenase